MGARTKIEWCDASWNPVTGCLNDCEYCYARRMAGRFDGHREYKPKSIKDMYPTLKEAVRVEKKGTYGNRPKIESYPYGFLPTFHEYRLDLPRRWPKHKVIFVCSMADLFGPWVPEEWITQVFEACRRSPQHTYLFLTKNPKRLCDMANARTLPKDENFWWGSTVERKGRTIYPGRITDHTFISIEPLQENLHAGLGSFGSAEWIIIGAETGSKRDKKLPEKEWIDNICAAADLTQAPVFMKDSLIPVVGEENMRREFPWDREK